MTRQTGLALLSLSLLGGLAGACADPVIEEPLARIDLQAALGRADVDPIAVTVTPENGARFVFDRTTGIYELDAAGVATMMLPIGQMPDPGVEVRLPYTDLVALGDDKFAVTAIGDGFLLDAAAGTMSLHFCYEPGWMPEEFTQRTDSVTYDPILDKIIAQPQTLNESNEIVSSDVGYYDRESGADESWYPLNTKFSAGGMAVDASGELFLGSGSKLYRYDRSQNLNVAVANLARFGVDSIDGLTFDVANGSLLVVDAARNELVEIDINEL